MTTLAEWEAELRELRTDLGPTRPLLIRWFPSHEAFYRYPLAIYLWKRLRQEELQVQRWEVAVYPPAATPGTAPIVVVDVAADTPLPPTQPLTVEVAGRPEPGGAVAFRFPRGDIAYGLTPARQAPLRRRRL